LAEDREGLRAFYLADYSVNPLGVKSHEEVRAALRRWIDLSATRAPLLVIACNTASARLDRCPELLERAESLGLQVYSMVDLLDHALRAEADGVAGRRVCLMGTRFTVTDGTYRQRLLEAGAREVVPLAATATERTVAHMEHGSVEGRETIEAEIGGAIGGVDTVLLACTCFPLVRDQIRQMNPRCEFVDPAAGVLSLPLPPTGSGPNRMWLTATGSVPSRARLREEAPVLFRGWALEEIRMVSPDMV
jgi:glutamate racemase